MTEHLPIQRWRKIYTRYPASEIVPSESGEYVTYDDHLAALRACERQMREEHRHRCSGCDWCYSDGVLEALDAAREAVEAVDPPSESYDDWYPKGKRLALEAIDALKAKP